MIRESMRRRADLHRLVGELAAMRWMFGALGVAALVIAVLARSEFHVAVLGVLYGLFAVLAATAFGLGRAYDWARHSAAVCCVVGALLFVLFAVRLLLGDREVTLAVGAGAFLFSAGAIYLWIPTTARRFQRARETLRELRELRQNGAAGPAERATTPRRRTPSSGR
jgi:hypothetical protein